MSIEFAILLFTVALFLVAVAQLVVTISR